MVAPRTRYSGRRGRTIRARASEINVWAAGDHSGQRRMTLPPSFSSFARTVGRRLKGGFAQRGEPCDQDFDRASSSTDQNSGNRALCVLANASK